MLENSNKKKVQRGANNHAGYKDYFMQLQKSGILKNVIPDFKEGYEAYDKKQFYAPFLIVFPDDEKWIIYRTTSYRSDRAKEYFWDIVNLKNIRRDISRAYLVYPDTIPKSDIKDFRRFANAVSTHALFTNLDGVYSFKAFKAKCEAKGLLGKNDGFIHNAKGVMFEQELANSLSNKANLKNLKRPSQANITFNSQFLKKVLDGLDIDPRDVVRIDASADREDIGLLPTKGQPKTDVIANVEMDDGDMKTITISCKKSGADWVSAAQFSAEAVAAALDPLDQDLKYLLEKFQAEGTLTSLSKSEQESLTTKLRPLLRTLSKWVLGGIGGIGNPKTQWARWIAIYKSDDPEDFEFWDIEEYVDHLLKNPKGNFGTPFHWTYASGQKGKSIQFKVKII